MHTHDELRADDFEYRYADESELINRSDVMPTIQPSDRVGLVVDRPFDGIGACNFVLSCMTAFYDCYRKENKSFFAYPDYFTFQPSSTQVDYLWFDIWPDHKNVETAFDLETNLRAINDRGINILLIPETVSAPDIDDIESYTLESAERRITDCFVYSRHGSLDHADFSIEMPKEPTWEWITRILDTVDESQSDLRDRRKAALRDELGDDTIRQEYERVSFDEAIHHLPNSQQSP
jgi:hypothetical protein